MTTTTILFIFCLLFCFCCSICTQHEQKRKLALISLDGDGLTKALQFAEKLDGAASLRGPSKKDKDGKSTTLMMPSVTIYSSLDDFMSSSKAIQDKLKCRTWSVNDGDGDFNGNGNDGVCEGSLKLKHSLITLDHLPDYNIATKEKTVEKVTAILEVLNTEALKWKKKSERRHQHQRKLSDKKDDGTILVSLAFRSDSQLLPTTNFLNIYEDLNDNIGVMLLEKNRHLTSVSDWHDLMAMRLRFSELYDSVKWIEDLTEVYYRHAGKHIRTSQTDSHESYGYGRYTDDIFQNGNNTLRRSAFNLLDPRLAIREASIRQIQKKGKDKINIAYFNHNHICVSSGKNKRDEQHFQMKHGQDYKCGEDQQSYLTLVCSHTDDHIRENLCAVLQEPMRWKHDISIGLPKTWPEYAWIPPEKFEHNVMTGMWSGIERFRQPEEPKDDKNREDFEKYMPPTDFCWNTGKTDFENKIKARVENGINNYTDFVHLNEKDKRDKITNSVTFLTGSKGAAGTLDKHMYLTLSKMYYCQRHGYQFLQLLSDQFLQYFPSNLWETSANSMARPTQGAHRGQSSYFGGVMSKVIMIAEAMLEQAVSDGATDENETWLVWTDDDVWINPGWLYLPFYETYLADVPKDKLYVASNYRATFTNVFSVRNNKEGRALVYDWISIIMSGHVECHGYDQAAMAILHLARLAGGEPPSRHQTPNSPPPPLFSTKTEENSSSKTSDSNTEQRAYNYSTATPFNHTCTYSESGKTGCNSKGDWSCDFKFEWSASRAGFETEKQNMFYAEIISSFTKGCSNNYWPDFHIVTEHKDRPRLQCGLCSRLDEIGSLGHWDGPLGGGNDKILRGSVNSWFFNHKAEFLFWESWLKPDSCKKTDLSVFVPECSDARSKLHVLTIYESLTSSDEQLSTSKLTPAQRDELKKAFWHQGRSLISLSDGFAFDIDAGSYCRVVDKDLKKIQLSTTYMKDYNKVEAMANSLTKEEWHDRYIHFGGGEGRDVCGHDDNNDKIDTKNKLKYSTNRYNTTDYEDGKLIHCSEGGRAIDNLRQPKKVSGQNDHMFYEKENYCRDCRVEQANWSQHGFHDENQFVVNCLL